LDLILDFDFGFGFFSLLFLVFVWGSVAGTGGGDQAEKKKGI
jgi:hypothetical protein